MNKEQYDQFMEEREDLKNDARDFFRAVANLHNEYNIRPRYGTHIEKVELHWDGFCVTVDEGGCRCGYCCTEEIYEFDNKYLFMEFDEAIELYKLESGITSKELAKQHKQLVNS